MRLVRFIWQHRTRIEKMPFAAGGPLLTLVFWMTIAIFLIGLWQSPVLPFGDYNYHLALGSILRRLVNRGSIEAQLYESNLFSYNSGFQILVAGLSFFMPPPYAGLVIFSGFWIGLGLAMIALARALGQPTERAFAVFPIFFAIPVSWGFINYCLALAVQLYVLARVIRRPRGGPVPIRYDAITGVVTMAALFSHLMATGLVYLLIFIALIVRTIEDRSSGTRSYLRTLREGLPFIPTLMVTASIYRYQQRFTSRYPDQYQDTFALTKVKEFLGYCCDYFADDSDQARLKYALLTLLLCFLFRTSPRGQQYPTLKIWFFCVSVIIYLIMPAYFWRTAVLYHRIPMIVVLFFALAVPRAAKIPEKIIASGLAVIGMWSALAFLDLRRAQKPDLRDFERVIAEAPSGRAITIHASFTNLEKTKQNWGGQISAYYVAARRGLESSVTYANIPSNPVHYRDGMTPSAAPDGVAQGAQGYSPSASYARHFDLVIVRTHDADPAPRLWGAKAGSVQLLSHHGSWWLYDARGYFATP